MDPRKRREERAPKQHFPGRDKKRPRPMGEGGDRQPDRSDWREETKAEDQTEQIDELQRKRGAR